MPVPTRNSFPNSTFSWGLGPHIVVGNTVFVDSTNALAVANTDGRRGKPFNSIENALNSGHISASNDDKIIVMPGHTETITTDGGIALDKAGVDIIGLGRGTDRPVIILDAVAAAVTVTAANCSMENIEFRASFGDITNAIDVTAAWFRLNNCEFTEEGTNLNFLDYILCSSTVDNTSDGLEVTNCVGTGVDTGMNNFVNILADLDRLLFHGNFFSVDHANALHSVVTATGKDLTDCMITWNYHLTLKASGDLFIQNDTTANTGIVAHNRVGHADTASMILVDMDGVRQFDNLANSLDTTSGFVMPAIDTDA